MNAMARPALCVLVILVIGLADAVLDSFSPDGRGRNASSKRRGRK